MLEVGIAEALAMISAGAIRDGKTIMLLQHAALHLFGAADSTVSGRLGLRSS